MSSSFDSDTGCGCLLILIIIGLAIGLTLTRPNETAHRRTIAEKAPVKHTLFTVMKTVSGAELNYHDYYLCSVMTARFSKTGREIPISIGLCGKVYYSDEN